MGTYLERRMKPQDVWVVGLQELFFLVLVISHFSTMGMYYIYRFSKKKRKKKQME